MCFGPVPSRRLGRSLGINNIPPKVCTYSCVYCQVGRTDRMQVSRQAFYKPRAVLAAVQEKMDALRASGEAVDYLTFVPDGEPTLDVNLGEHIQLLKPLNVRIAVISNSSLLTDPSVRRDLGGADLVSLKVDAVTHSVWRRMSRPHGRLELDGILCGIAELAGTLPGTLITETQLVAGVNDAEAELGRIAEFLKQVSPDRAYIAVPTRPPAEDWVRPAGENALNTAYQLFGEALGHERVEYLVGYEGNAFAATGDVEEEILSITAVHPMRRDAVARLLERAKAGWNVVQRLIDTGQLVEVEYQGNLFYLRRLSAVP